MKKNLHLVWGRSIANHGTNIGYHLVMTNIEIDGLPIKFY